MAILESNSIRSSSSSFNSPVQFLTSGGTQNGTLCRAWCKWGYSGGTPVIDADFNVTSLTDVDTGTVTVNFTNALGSNNYAVTCGNNLGNSATTQIISSVTTSGVTIALRYDGGTLYDVSYNSCIIMST